MEIDDTEKHVQNHPCPGTCRKEILEGDCCAPNTSNEGCEYYTNWLKAEEEKANKPKQPINY